MILRDRVHHISPWMLPTISCVLCTPKRVMRETSQWHSGLTTARKSRLYLFSTVCPLPLPSLAQLRLLYSLSCGRLSWLGPMASTSFILDPRLLLVGNVVAASDVEHVVESAVALNVETTLFGAARLGGAYTGWVGSSTWCWVRIFGGRCRKGERCDRSDDDEKLHVGGDSRLRDGFNDDVYGWCHV